MYHAMSSAKRLYSGHVLVASPGGFGVTPDGTQHQIASGRPPHPADTRSFELGCNAKNRAADEGSVLPLPILVLGPV